MRKSKFIMETYFSGDAKEWLNQIPESVIDKAIQILEFDPDKEMEPKGYTTVHRDLSWWNTAKVCFWGDLVRVIHRWGLPSPSELGTSPANLRDHAEDLKRKLHEALDVLKALEYGPLYEKGTMTKEFIIANRIRQASEIAHAAVEGRNCTFVAPVAIKQEYEGKTHWEKHYPFDHELEDTINGLEKIARYTDKVLADAQNAVPSTGTKKKAKDNNDYLVWGLCHLYKKYTGKLPISWNTGTSAINANQFTGSIIPFLQLTSLI